MLQINNVYWPAGGTESYLLHILGGLQDAGVEVGAMFGIKVGTEFATGRWPELHVPALCEASGLDKVARRRAVEAAIDEFDPDVVHVNNLFEPDSIEWLCARRPVVQFVHLHMPLSCPGSGRFLPGTTETCTRRVGPFCAVAPWIQRCGSRKPWRHLPTIARAWRYAASARRIRRFLVASEYMREELASNGVPRERIVVVPLPAPSPSPPGEGGTEAPSLTEARADGRPVVLFAGRLIEQKGAHLLVRALAHISTPCQLVIAGDGPQQAELERLARVAPARHRITLVGWLDSGDVRRWNALARLVAVPSILPEPFGLVGLDAMVAGKPVVGFDRGGISEWLANDVSGLLAPGGDVAALGAAIERLLADPSLAEAMGAAGRGIARDRFALERHREALLEVYRAVAREATGSRGAAASERRASRQP